MPHPYTTKIRCKKVISDRGNFQFKDGFLPFNLPQAVANQGKDPICYTYPSPQYGYRSIVPSEMIFHNDNKIPVIVLNTCARTGCGRTERRKNEFNICSACITPYCSRICQQEDWHQHKSFCQSIDGTTSYLNFIYDKVQRKSTSAEDIYNLMIKRIDPKKITGLIDEESPTEVEKYIRFFISIKSSQRGCHPIT